MTTPNKPSPDLKQALLKRSQEIANNVTHPNRLLARVKANARNKDQQ